MLEQPFPPRLLWPGSVEGGCLHEWRAARDACAAAGVAVFADESVRGAADVPGLADVAHGVNLKVWGLGFRV